MAREKAKQEEESGGEGAPLWMISFADMMSLLMAFFLMLTTFSSFGPKEEAQLRSAVMVALAPFGDLMGHGVFESSGDDMSRGANPGGDSEGAQSSDKQAFDRSKGMLRPTNAPDFRTHKVFTAESRDMFWSSGVSLSTHGRAFLDAIAAYAARLHGPLVVGESGAAPDSLGTQRAIATAHYLIGLGVPEETINISAGTLQPPTDDDGRKLQVTFLAGAIRQ
jgi:hypothetical protein